MAAPNVCIICVKEHEYDVFVKQLNDWAGQGRLILTDAAEPQFPMVFSGIQERRYTAHVKGLTNEFDLTVATFLDQQGPVAAASRAMLLMTEALHSTRGRFTHLGMVGICGGVKLSQVIFGTCAVNAEGGKMVETAAGNFELAQDKKQTVITPVGLDGHVDSALGAVQTMVSGISVTRGEFKMYSAVRDDLKECLPADRNNVGVEMESFALFEAVRFLGNNRPELLPVVKGTSDVDTRFVDDAEFRHAAHNQKEFLEKIGPSWRDLDDIPRRRAYREHAGAAAAQAMLAYLLTSKQLTQEAAGGRSMKRKPAAPHQGGARDGGGQGSYNQAVVGNNVSDSAHFHVSF